MFSKFFEDENEFSLVVLFKLRALSLLRIFFRYPKNLLAACFDLFNSSTAEGVQKEVLFFLSQVTSSLDIDCSLPADNTIGKHEESTGSAEIGSKLIEFTRRELVSDDNNASEDAYPIWKSCLLGLVLLRSFFIS